MSVTYWCPACFCAVLCVCFCTGHFVMVPLHFWLAVHGKPVLFWKGNSGLKFPCFLFMHANGTGPFEFRAVPIL